jgi:hypothetical protein
MTPTASALDGLVGSGTSSISSLSAVGISRPSQGGITKPLIAPSRFQRARLPLAFLTLAVVVGGGAFALARSTAKVPQPVENTTTVATQKPEAPVVPAVKPDPTTAEAPSAAPTETETTATEPAGSARATKATPHPSATATPPPTGTSRRRQKWRDDPGF